MMQVQLRFGLFRAALLGCTALIAPLAAGAQTIAPDARPQLDRVVAGGISIQQDAARTQVNQSQQRGIVDWRGFNIGSGHHVQFQQPSSSAITLNRVTGPDPSVIAGRITANGRVAIVNQSGVVFSQGAQVEAAGLIASSADISNENFLAGRRVFDRAGRPDARVENAGSITIREAGLAALVAPQVANRGTITARLGRVALAGGETHAVDLHGDGLFAIEVTGPVRQAPGGGVALVTNTGVIEAQGGSVQLTAAAADGLVQDLVRAGGRIAADTDATTGRAGRVLVSGTGGAVRIEGEVRAAGTAPGTRGGTVEVVADRVLVAGTARVNASGAASGGEVAIGTTRRGSSQPRVARRTGVARGATITADATQRGNGGTVTVNSQDLTVQSGTISARGGPQGGDGGFVEVSGGGGMQLDGTVDVSAPAGQPGTILIDPVDLFIVGDADTITGAPQPVDNALLDDFILGATEGPDTAYLRQSQIANLFGDVRLEASRDIFVNAALYGNASIPGALTLDAGRDIEVNDTISGFNGLTLRAATGDIRIQGFGYLNDYLGAGINLLAGNAIRIGGDIYTAGTLTMQAGAGGITQTAPVEAAVLRLATTGSAILDFEVPDMVEGLPNRIGTLGPSDVAGDLTLRTSVYGVQGGLDLDGAIRVGGTLTLLPDGTVQQLAGSTLTANALEASTFFGGIYLTGDNRIGRITRMFAPGTIELRNVQDLLVAGPVESLSVATVAMDVVGDLTIADAITSDSQVRLRASGNLVLTPTGSITGFYFPYITLQAGVDFAADGGFGAVNPAAAGGISLAGAVNAMDGSLVLGAGRGGIVQSGGAIQASYLDVLSGGDALLSSTGNSVLELYGLQAAGNFVLDNGTTDLAVWTGLEGPAGTAATIGLRSAGTIMVGAGSTLIAPGSEGRISFNAGHLVLEGSSVSAGLVEIAPYGTAPVTLPVPQIATAPGSGFELTAGDLAAITADTLRIGGTQFNGTLETTAESIRFAGPVSLPGTLDLRSAGHVTQDAGADLSIGTLTGAAGGPVSLFNSGNSLSTLGDFSAGGDFMLWATAPLLSVPGGRTVAAGGALEIALLGGDLTVDGTVSGASAGLFADGGVTVNGFSAIAHAGDLTLHGSAVTLNGLAAASGDINIYAGYAASLAGQARTANTLLVSAPTVTFGGLDARDAAVRLSLDAHGIATGELHARGLTVLGGSGVELTGTLAGIAGPAAAALGTRATFQGEPLSEPLPNAHDFTFNACPIGTAVCAAPVTGLPLAANPDAVTGDLDPATTVAAQERIRPIVPDIAIRPARDRAEDEELAPPDVRGGDF